MIAIAKLSTACGLDFPVWHNQHSSHPGRNLAVVAWFAGGIPHDLDRKLHHLAWAELPGLRVGLHLRHHPAVTGPVWLVRIGVVGAATALVVVSLLIIAVIGIVFLVILLLMLVVIVLMLVLLQRTPTSIGR